MKKKFLAAKMKRTIFCSDCLDQNGQKFSLENKWIVKAFLLVKNIKIWTLFAAGHMVCALIFWAAEWNEKMQSPFPVSWLQQSTVPFGELLITQTFSQVRPSVKKTGRCFKDAYLLLYVLNSQSHDTVLTDTAVSIFYRCDLSLIKIEWFYRVG